MTSPLQPTIKNITVHCAATKPDMDVGAKEIREWHIARNFADIGYHYVIRRNGHVEKGRQDHVVGAHVSGHNHGNLGICLVGGISDKGNPANNFTDEQFDALKHLLKRLSLKHPDAKVLGHKDWPGVKKACPSFNVKNWIKEKM